MIPLAQRDEAGFLEGLSQFRANDWASIARLVQTRTPSQTRPGLFRITF